MLRNLKAKTLTASVSSWRQRRLRWAPRSGAGAKVLLQTPVGRLLMGRDTASSLEHVVDSRPALPMTEAPGTLKCVDLNA